MTSRRGALARFGTVALTVAMVLVVAAGAAIRAGSTLVHDALLQPGIYERSLATNDVYRRVYTEILTDRQVRDATDELLGGLTVQGTSLTDTSALSVALVRLALPPTRLRDISDELIRDVLAYLRGESPVLDADVDLSAVLRSLDLTVDVALRQLLTETATRVLGDLDAYTAAVRSFADDLADGAVPAVIPIVGGNAVSEEEIFSVIDAIAGLGVSPQVRDQVRAAVESGDEREALIAASSILVREHLERFVGDLQRSDGTRIDLVDELGRAVGQPQRTAVAELNTIRGALRWAPAWAGDAALGVMVLALGVVVWLHRRSPARAVILTGVTLAVASIATALIWSVIARRFGSPLAAVTDPSARRALPDAVRHVLIDVDRSLRGEMRGVVNRHVDASFVAGVGLVAVGSVPFLARLVTRVRPAVAVGAGVALVAGIGAVVVLRAPDPDPVVVRRCNGYAELCDRPYDQVVQPATHNSMSSADVMLAWPEHDGGIRAQLEAGVRALLIDTRYWERVEGPSDLSTFEQVLPADLAAVLYALLGQRLDGRSGTYLCHNQCAYGAVSLRLALGTIRDFLDTNPDEVVTLIIQNGITTEDTEAAFVDAGLEPYLYDGDPTGGWPTLGELVDSDQRLVVIAERAGPPPDWYHDGRELLTDTSFAVRDPTEFTCVRRRGDPDAPLFLLNHWISRRVPDRADAALVNQRSFIVERARTCAAITGRLPTYVAVDFYSLGDVVGAVANLNGVER